MKGSIIFQVCAEFEITPEQFFGASRNGSISPARREAVKRLHEAGFSQVGMARVMKCDRSTIQYWLNPERRAKQISDHKNRYQAHGRRGRPRKVQAEEMFA